MQKMYMHSGKINYDQQTPTRSFTCASNKYKHNMYAKHVYAFWAVHLIAG